MGISKNITGWRFGRWKAIQRSESDKGKWICLCDCGREKAVALYNLLGGASKSCGCLHNEQAAKRLAERNRTRRKANPVKKHPLYIMWQGMKQRCGNPNHDMYAYYGGRGISVCARWLDFRTFAADMGPRPEGMTIERENNDGNYEPGNCRWATPREQANNARSNRLLTIESESFTIAEASRRFGVNRSTIATRLTKCLSPCESIYSGRRKRIIRNPRKAWPRKEDCKRGHKLEGDNVYYEPKTGNRACRTCRSLHSRNRRRKASNP